MEKALIGYGGHAKEVMSQMGTKIKCFVDDKYITDDCLPISTFNPLKFKIMVAVSNPQDRLSIIKRLPKETQYFTFIHPTSLILDSVEIGYGSFIGAYSVLTTNIRIGNHALLNRSNHVGHDCCVGDFFSMMPGSIISGNVTIGDNVYIGTNSSIKEKIKICSNVIVGLNTGIVKNINEPGTYVGNSTKKIC